MDKDFVDAINSLTGEVKRLAEEVSELILELKVPEQNNVPQVYLKAIQEFMEMKDDKWYKWSEIREELKSFSKDWNVSQPTADKKLKICVEYGVLDFKREGNWAMFVKPRRDLPDPEGF